MEGNRPFMPPPPPPGQRPQAPAGQPVQNVQPQQNANAPQTQNAGPDFSYTQALPQEKPKEKKKKEKPQKAQSAEKKTDKKERVFDGKGLIAPLLFLLSAVIAVGLVIIFVLYRDKLF